MWEKQFIVFSVQFTGILPIDDGILFAEQVEEYLNCRETWQELEFPEVLRYALPLCGMMSKKIVQLRSRIKTLQKENAGSVAVRRMRKIFRLVLNRWERMANKSDNMR